MHVQAQLLGHTGNKHYSKSSLYWTWHYSDGSEKGVEDINLPLIGLI
jgi:hypothetical protein